VIVYP